MYRFFGGFFLEKKSLATFLIHIKGIRYLIDQTSLIIPGSMPYGVFEVSLFKYWKLAAKGAPQFVDLLFLNLGTTAAWKFAIHGIFCEFLLL